MEVTDREAKATDGNHPDTMEQRIRGFLLREVLEPDALQFRIQALSVLQAKGDAQRQEGRETWLIGRRLSKGWSAVSSAILTINRDAPNVRMRERV